MRRTVCKKEHCALTLPLTPSWPPSSLCPLFVCRRLPEHQCGAGWLHVGADHLLPMQPIPVRPERRCLRLLCVWVADRCRQPQPGAPVWGWAAAVVKRQVREELKEKMRVTYAENCGQARLCSHRLPCCCDGRQGLSKCSWSACLGCKSEDQRLKLCACSFLLTMN